MTYSVIKTQKEGLWLDYFRWNFVYNMSNDTFLQLQIYRIHEWIELEQYSCHEFLLYKLLYHQGGAAMNCRRGVVIFAHVDYNKINGKMVWFFIYMHLWHFIYVIAIKVQHGSPHWLHRPRHNLDILWGSTGTQNPVTWARDQRG